MFKAQWSVLITLALTLSNGIVLHNVFMRVTQFLQLEMIISLEREMCHKLFHVLRVGIQHRWFHIVMYVLLP